TEVYPRDRAGVRVVHAGAAHLSRDRHRGDDAARAARPSALDPATGFRGSALDGVRHLPARFPGTAAQTTRGLIDLALRAHLLVARRASDDLLADALDLLSGALEFLLRRLTADCSHVSLQLSQASRRKPPQVCPSRPVPSPFVVFD